MFVFRSITSCLTDFRCDGTNGSLLAFRIDLLHIKIKAGRKETINVSVINPESCQCKSVILQNGTAMNDFFQFRIVINGPFVIGIPEKIFGTISRFQKYIAIIFHLDQWITFVYFDRVTEWTLDFSIIWK